MKHLNILPGVLACALFMSTGALAQNATLPDRSRLDVARTALAEQQPGFVENRGQWHPDARFMARVNGLDLWVTNKGLVYDLYRMEQDASKKIEGRTGHVVNMRFVGAGSDAAAAGEGAQPGAFNYFIGKDRSRWATNVRRYSEARINSIYPGIDARLYFEEGSPRYDLVVAPGGDPSAIKVAYDGAEKVTVNSAGNLVFSTSMGEVAQQGLFAYQIVNGKMRQVPCQFNIGKDGTASFQLAHGSYDRTLPLVIDPIIYSTYLGGSAWDEARAVAVDSSSTVHRLYVTGFTLSNNFPTVPGSYQTTYAGNGSAMPGGDVFVARIDPSEAPAIQLNWATYIGSNTDDAGTDIAIDATSSVYITGVAGSEFPITTNIANANARGVFAVKLSPLGNFLTYSTFVCDNASDFDPALVLGSGNRLYITGGTTSELFPVTANAYQATKAAGSDAFVAVVAADGASLTYGSYLGGNLDDAGTGIAAGSFGEIYLTGRTASANFPMRRNLAYDTTHNGDMDIFITKLDIEQSSASQLVYSSLFGGSGADIPTHLLYDALNQIVVIGSTTSSDFPVKNAHQASYGGGGDAFILRMSPSVIPANQITYSTYLGGSGSDAATDAAVTRNGDLYVTGWAGRGFPLTVNAIDSSYGGDSSDVFISKLNTQGRLLYSSYFGGSAGDKGYGLALGKSQNIFLVGQTVANDFPVSRTPYQTTLRSDNRPDAFVVQMAMLELTSPIGGDTLCSGSAYTITWNGVAGRNYDLYISSDSGRTYNPLTFNVTGTSYRWNIPANFPAGTGYRIKVNTTEQPEFDVSDSNFVINALPIITRQPQNATQVAGGTAIFIAQATGTPAPTVQWQSNSNGTWVTIGGQTGTTLRLENITAAQKGTRYRAIFTNSCGSVTSEAALLDVSALQVTSPAGGEELCAGTVHTITWLAQSTAGPFDIFLSSNDGGDYTSIATGVTGSSYNWAIPSTLFGTRFRVQVRITNAAAIDVSDSSFTIHSLPSVLTNPASQTQPEGGTASFQAQGGGFPLPTVQWQVNTGGEWTNIPDATGLGLSVENLQMTQSGARYRAIFTNTCGADTTDEAVLTVSQPTGVDREISAAFGLTVAPNPMVGSGSIRFTLPRAARVELTITDMHGRVVARPLDAAVGAGEHAVPFDAAALPSGTYMVDIAAGREHQAVKLTITR